MSDYQRFWISEFVRGALQGDSDLCLRAWSALRHWEEALAILRPYRSDEADGGQDLKGQPEPTQPTHGGTNAHPL